MTPDQKKALLAACEADDAVAMVTAALAIAAHASRTGDRTSAVAIREMVDGWQNRNSAVKQWRETRLHIAAAIERPAPVYPKTALEEAECLMRANVDMPVDMVGDGGA